MMMANGDVVEEREQKVGRRLGDKLVPLLVVMVLVLLLVCAVLSVIAISAANDASSAADRATVNSHRIAGVERRDRTALRQAAWRTCEREQRDRAEQHLRAGLSPPPVIKRLVQQLGLPDRLAVQVSIEAVRRRLPIFDCKPNLIGRQARPLTAREQKAYVKKYGAGKLDATPGIP